MSPYYQLAQLYGIWGAASQLLRDGDAVAYWRNSNDLSLWFVRDMLARRLRDLRGSRLTRT